MHIKLVQDPYILCMLPHAELSTNTPPRDGRPLLKGCIYMEESDTFPWLKVGPGRPGRAPAPFDLPSLYRVACLLSCSSKSHKIPPRMHHNSSFSDQKSKRKVSGEGHSPRIAGKVPASFFDHFKHCTFHLCNDHRSYSRSRIV